MDNPELFLLKTQLASLQQRLDLLERKADFSPEEDPAVFFETTGLSIPTPIVQDAVGGDGEKGFPYGIKWPFGFEAVAVKSGETYAITVRIFNVCLGSPTFGKNASGFFGDQPDRYDALWERLPLTITLDPSIVDSSGRLFIAMQCSFSSNIPGATLQQFATYGECLESYDESMDGLIARVRLFQLSADFTTGACDIVTDFIHFGLPPWI